MFLLPSLPPNPPTPPAAICGPPAPALKGVALRSTTFSLAKATRAALREMPGAVVLIEDDSPAFLTKIPPTLRLLHGNLRLFTGGGTSPMPVWMDPNVTMSGGNVASRVYSFGGGGF